MFSHVSGTIFWMVIYTFHVLIDCCFSATNIFLQFILAFDRKKKEKKHFFCEFNKKQKKWFSTRNKTPILKGNSKVNCTQFETLSLSIGKQISMFQSPTDWSIQTDFGINNIGEHCA